MEIIPVVDLSGGQVVHARRGDRARYRPLLSTLCEDAVPDSVVAALLAMFPWQRMYIADLDAIGGRGHHLPAIRRLRQRYPQVEFWVDAGFGSTASLTALEGGPGIVPVVGSETLPDVDTFLAIRSVRPDAILSLDFRADEFLGPPGLLEHPAYWCERVVHLDLQQVGSASGPRLAAISSLRRRAPHHRFYAGGGIRDGADLQRLASAGIDGGLIATALHDGSIGRETLAAVTTR